MARAKNQRNGRLEEAMATLLQNQALFLGQVADMNHRFDERFARMDERFTRMDESFARMEAILVQHSQILNEHTRILQALPEAIREKIGFKVQQ
jgi:hypothetical protein